MLLSLALTALLLIVRVSVEGTVLSNHCSRESTLTIPPSHRACVGVFHTDDKIIALTKGTNAARNIKVQLRKAEFRGHLSQSIAGLSQNTLLVGQKKTIRSRQEKKAEALVHP